MRGFERGKRVVRGHVPCFAMGAACRTDIVAVVGPGGGGSRCLMRRLGGGLGERALSKAD
jgi:ABC-type hemin transport system ATPase subunit